MTNQKFKFGDKVMWRGRKAIFLAKYDDVLLKDIAYVALSSNCRDVEILELKRGWK